MDSDKAIDWSVVSDCLQAIGKEGLTAADTEFVKFVMDMDCDGTVASRDVEQSFKLLKR